MEVPGQSANLNFQVTATTTAACPKNSANLARDLDHHAKEPNIPCGGIPHFDLCQVIELARREHVQTTRVEARRGPIAAATESEGHVGQPDRVTDP